MSFTAGDKVQRTGAGRSKCQVPVGTIGEVVWANVTSCTVAWTDYFHETYVYIGEPMLVRVERGEGGCSVDVASNRPKPAELEMSNTVKRWDDDISLARHNDLVALAYVAKGVNGRQAGRTVEYDDLAVLGLRYDAVGGRWLAKVRLVRLAGHSPKFTVEIYGPVSWMSPGKLSHGGHGRVLKVEPENAHEAPRAPWGKRYGVNQVTGYWSPEE